LLAATFGRNPRIPDTKRLLTLVFLLWTPAAPAQNAPPRPPFADGPWTYQTYENGGTAIRVSIVTKGLEHPWSMAWLPDGDLLITERPGRLRMVHDGVLDPEPITGTEGLAIDRFFDLALHPQFERNGFLYLTYIKRAPHPDGSGEYWATTALARGKLEGRRLTGVEDVFIADAWRPLPGGDGARVIFAPDGTLFLTSSHRRNPDDPQNIGNHVGKILRLKDDGSVPVDNPFVGRAGHAPEIYSYGHRTMLGLTFHPETGALWETENGPQGGDEVNIIEAGMNYGWPLATYGREYDGTKATATPWIAGMQPPELFWVPSIAASGIAFYTGDRIPAWKGNLFLGAMTVGRVPGTGNLQRIVFAANGGEIRRETLLADLHQRIRDVRQGPDGLLYLLTDEDDGALLVIEPAP
jgi:glucose/arabinose dehydrogenase